MRFGNVLKLTESIKLFRCTTLFTVAGVHNTSVNQEAFHCGLPLRKPESTRGHVHSISQQNRTQKTGSVVVVVVVVVVVRSGGGGGGWRRRWWWWWWFVGVNWSDQKRAQIQLSLVLMYPSQQVAWITIEPASKHMLFWPRDMQNCVGTIVKWAGGYPRDPTNFMTSHHQFAQEECQTVKPFLRIFKVCVDSLEGNPQPRY